MEVPEREFESCKLHATDLMAFYRWLEWLFKERTVVSSGDTSLLDSRGKHLGND